MSSKKQLILWPIVIMALLLLVTGCTKRYVITQDLEAPLKPQPRCVITDIRDELPADLDPAKKPTLEDINKFKTNLVNALISKEVFGDAIMYDTTHTQYEINGAILHYKKGSGFLRFLFGALAGSAEVTTMLQMKDRETKELVFAGNFTGKVTDWSESGDKMFKIIADDFAKAIKKKNEKLLKGN